MNTKFIVIGNHRGYNEFHGEFESLAVAKDAVEVASDLVFPLEWSVIGRNDFLFTGITANDGGVTTQFYIIEVYVPEPTDRYSLQQRFEDKLNRNLNSVE